MQWVKDLVLSLVWPWLLLWPRFYPWPRNFHMPQAQTKKKKKKERKKKEVTRRVTGDLGSVLQEEHILLILKMSV